VTEIAFEHQPAVFFENIRGSMAQHSQAQVAGHACSKPVLVTQGDALR
jgi:hypothetical protein